MGGGAHRQSLEPAHAAASAAGRRLARGVRTDLAGVRGDDDMDTIIGTWRLVRAAASAADGAPLPPPYGGQGMGRVTFNADGRMMAVLCDGRPSLPEGAV